MELLDLLEQRVGSLLDEVAALRVENRRLREEVAAGQHKDEEIRALRDEAAQEKQVRAPAAACWWFCICLTRPEERRAKTSNQTAAPT